MNPQAVLPSSRSPAPRAAVEVLSPKDPKRLEKTLLAPKSTKGLPAFFAAASPLLVGDYGVLGAGIEPATRGFSVRAPEDGCRQKNRAIELFLKKSANSLPGSSPSSL